MHREELKEHAINLGFDSDFVMDILTKYGQEVLILVIEAARNGFSVDFVKEIMGKLGPILLELIVEVINRQKMEGFAANPTGFSAGAVIDGSIIEGIEGPFIDILVEKYLPQIIQKYLPLILEKYGDKLIQMLIELFLKNLQK